MSMLIFGTKMLAQQTFFDKTKPLQYSGYAMIEDSIPENRLAAAKTFKELLIKTLKKRKSFQNLLDSLPMLSIKAPEDSTFRLITWQVKASALDYRVFGLLQLNNNNNTVVVLKNNDKQIEYPDLTRLGTDNWYGALYYNIVPFKGDKGKMYALFGYNALNDFNHQKICDVLYFENGRTFFGAPVFAQKDKENRFRLIFEYSAETKMKLNFDTNLNAIVFDKLDATESQYKEQLQLVGLSSITNVPTGSYDGYKLNRGEWNYEKEIVKTTVMDKAPRPMPVLDQKEKDPITGGAKGRKKA